MFQTSPTNCSRELQELLVNGLEFEKEKRRCKSALELKSKLQKIQFNNIRIYSEMEEFNREKERIKSNKKIGDYKAKKFLFKEIIEDIEYFGLHQENIASAALKENIGEYLFDLIKNIDDGQCYKEEYEMADAYLSLAAESPDNLKAKYLHGIILYDELGARNIWVLEGGVRNKARSEAKKYLSK